MYRPTIALDALRPYMLLVVRLILGYLLIRHGLDKFDAGLGNVGDQFDIWGVPLPDLSAGFTAVVEVVGGIGLVLGVGTRYVALLMTAVLIGAIFFVKADIGVLGGSETDLAYIAGLLSLAVSGPGRWALDDQLGLEAASSDDPVLPRRTVDA